jgi:hypothetical protein
MRKLVILLLASSLYSSCAMFGKGCCKKKENCGDKKECSIEKDGTKKQCCMGEKKD